MSKIKTRNNWVFVAFCAFGLSAILSVIINNSAFAAGSGIVENGDARWEYILEDATANKPQVLTIKFYDKTPSATTVTVPSLDWLKANISGVDSTINTYYLKDANQTQQDANYSPSPARRSATANTTKLDMTNTSKIQILGVKPIIDPAVETELVFGSNMVIGDSPAKRAWVPRCKIPENYPYSSISCIYSDDPWVEGFEGAISGWDSMTDEEKEAYEPTIQEVASYTGCTITTSPFIPTSDPSACYYYTERSNMDDYKPFSVTNIRRGYVFAGYKLKLTNFASSNFNYIGWNTFANSTFNSSNTSFSIDSNVFGGSYIFSGTNIKNISISTTDTGAGLFKNCRNISTITISDNVDTIVEDTFAGTNLTSFNFGTFGIKRIKARAFEGADLTSVDLTGVERIDYRAFKDNDIKELYLPKSINYLEVEAFLNNSHLKKITTAYDTMTSGTIHPLFEVLSNKHSSFTDTDTESVVEEIIVLAPYEANEQVSATHLTMDDYLYHYDDNMVYHAEEITRHCIDVSSNANYWAMVYSYNNGYICTKQATEPEKRWAKPDEKKNVVAPRYFANLHNLKKITVGDGYEYIGAAAFIDLTGSRDEWGHPWSHPASSCSKTDFDCTSARKIEKILLPDSLKGVGEISFGSAWYPDMEVTIPRNIEYIGQAAFKKMYTLDIDVDFPNLKFLGDDAFTATLVRNIHLYDKLEYMGWYVFHECPGINDVTFDLDFFNPDNLILAGKVLVDDESWANVGSSEGNTYKKFIAQFGGESSRTDWSQVADEAWGLHSGSSSSGYYQKYGKITFTEKAVTAPYIFSYPGRRYSGVINTTIPDNASTPSSPNGHYFGGVVADEIDLSAAPWKVISPDLFHNTTLRKFTLPSTVEVIGAMAFNHAMIEEELVLPNTLKMIGDSAFECWEQAGCYEERSIKITKLPQSLEFIGNMAFWGDMNMTADLYAPGLKRIYRQAFERSGVRDVYIPSTVEWLTSGTFNYAPNLRDITIDADWASIVDNMDRSGPAAYDSFPQSLIDYATIAGYDAYRVVDDKIVGESMNWYFDEPYATFYSIFNQTMKFEEEGSYRERLVNEEGMTTWRTLSTKGQCTAGEQFGALVFTSKSTTDITGSTGIFSCLSFTTVDLGDANWKKIAETPYAFANSHIDTLILPSGLETVTEGAFHDAVIGEIFVMPTTIKTIDRAAFQGATGTITNALPEGLKAINEAAFYDANMADNLTIPSTVEHIGRSAFNAGSQDVHYGTVTIKPALAYDNTDGQLVHQFLWGSSLDKLVVESSTLPALSANISETGYQEFWNMDMDEVILKNLTGISFAAFEGCDNLTKVDATGDPNLALIGEQAFVDDEKLDTFLFAPGSKNKVITVGSNAFSGTGFTELGDASSKFDLTAAKFDATPGYSFANMPKLKKVTVPRNFSGAIIPEYTFYNDALLEEATVDYKITDIKNAAFAKDDNLKRIFIWGDTIVEDQSLDGYTAPTRGPSTSVGPTIPAGTDIYAYSTAKTEAYAASEQRESFEGTFYPLDEVLYLTSNHPIVLLNEDDTDFDKSDLTVYAMRRDGIILESDSWQEFDGNAYVRAGKGINFEHMAETIAVDEDFGTVWDTPVPLNELDLSNQNFANLAYNIRPATDDPAILTVDLIHPDKYTAYLSNTNIDPRDYVPEPIPDPIPDPTPDPEPTPTPTPTPPKTLDEIAKFVSIFAGSGIVAAAIYFAVRKRR